MTSCRGEIPARGLFLYSHQTQRTVIQALSVEGTEEEVFCQLFGCKDFRGMILPLSIIRVRHSWDTEARVSTREGHEALLACSSKEAPSRILFRGRSVMSFFEPQTDLPRLIVQDASKRSNGLSRKRVPSSGEYSCLRVPTLPNSNHRKRQNHTTKILATE